VYRPGGGVDRPRLPAPSTSDRHIGGKLEGGAALAAAGVAGVMTPEQRRIRAARNAKRTSTESVQLAESKFPQRA